ncbi:MULTISPECIES: DUF5989 family protein [Sphingobium]|uniref:Uncharacterized protein n=1 Tax=Sphingobium chungbukense TaxID=56193 RepID=A0A0M3AQF1_9SPHN|nr:MULTISPECIES: DUF5989 family protein [Sphingobium]KKW90754.1 hypothetical protein YP76_19635 [Sphingobium chungbukense]PJG46589.1 hypothetical protein CAF53_20820 [Sphingobium sp. LB126]
MIRRKGRLRRQLIIAGSASATVADLVRGLWHASGGRRWMIPLVVFLCSLGVILTLAAGVEALAPFIYSIF